MVKQVFEFNEGEVTRILANHVREKDLIPVGSYSVISKVTGRADGKKGYIITLYVEKDGA